jgi:hypothetical protein
MSYYLDIEKIQIFGNSNYDYSDKAEMVFQIYTRKELLNETDIEIICMDFLDMNNFRKRIGVDNVSKETPLIFIYGQYLGSYPELVYYHLSNKLITLL